MWDKMTMSRVWKQLFSKSALKTRHVADISCYNWSLKKKWNGRNEMKRKRNCHIEKISINLISLETCVVVFSWSCAFYCTREIDFQIQHEQNEGLKKKSDDSYGWDGKKMIVTDEIGRHDPKNQIKLKDFPFSNTFFSESNRNSIAVGCQYL